MLGLSLKRSCPGWDRARWSPGDAWSMERVSDDGRGRGEGPVGGTR